MSFRRSLQRATARTAAPQRGNDRPRALGVVWGKSEGLPAPYPLIAHLLDAAAMIVALGSDNFRMGFGGASKALGRQELLCLALLAALHDLGKAITGFAARDKTAWLAMWKGKPPFSEGFSRAHTAPGHASAIQDGWIAQMVAAGPAVKTVIEYVGLVVGSHHGKVPGLMNTTDALTALAASGDAQADWVWVRSEIAHTVWQALGSPMFSADEDERSSRALAVAGACGMVQWADWIVSQESYIQRRMEHLPGPRGWTVEAARAFFESGIEAAAAELKRIGVRPLKLQKQTFVERFGFEPRGVQLSLRQELAPMITGPGLLVITDRTGAGKTQASLDAFSMMRERLNEERGLLFVLPTMATTDAMFGRVVKDMRRTLGEDATVELLHSMASFSEEAARLLERRPGTAEAVGGAAMDKAVIESDCERGSPYRSKWMSQGARRLHATVGVCTIDQLLAISLPSRFQPLRMAGLRDKVVVIDEAHTCDAYSQSLLRRTLMWLGAIGVPVIVLSATLPDKLTRSLRDSYDVGAACWRRINGLGTVEQSGHEQRAPYPGWLYYDARSARTQVRHSPVGEVAQLSFRLHAMELAERDLAKRGVQMAERCRSVLDAIFAPGGQGNALIVVNTVTAAQALAVRLRAQAPADCRVELLHARFPVGERGRRTDRLEQQFGKPGSRDSEQRLARPRRSILVATSVVEQSLDWDFDVVISELAPMSLLFQRAGRAHRHRSGGQIPRAWRQWSVHVLAGIEQGLPVEAVPYPLDELMATWEALEERTGNGLEAAAGLPGRLVEVPTGVQELVERATRDQLWLCSEDERFAEAAMACWSEATVQAGQGEQVVIPRPDLRVKDLHKLTSASEDVETILTTRLGADSVRLLPVWTKDDQMFLDADCTLPMPQVPEEEDEEKPGRKKKRKRVDQEIVWSIVKHTISARSAFWHEEARSPSPGWFDRDPALERVVTVEFERTATDHRIADTDVTITGHAPVHPISAYRVLLSEDLGLFAAFSRRYR
ncbi:CRISPR-associated helicase Cas3' [Nocardiopsis ansamitocini]|uniref:CRISPR-associated helicase Cas3 n=1 Tax=Nocardiopsis ansamitocini TaxID=1670832 RepID=A0A9W6P706_9ACTN|nr:CRISPR-associated helicase Cas3' [Nocardiopsis ansamitocini]GLU48644.1 hypothetical protein Nans01_29950 [Nocardiopsis ansamitocini]